MVYIIILKLHIKSNNINPIQGSEGLYKIIRCEVNCVGDRLLEESEMKTSKV